jgi:hypothetical protein
LPESHGGSPSPNHPHFPFSLSNNNLVADSEEITDCVYQSIPFVIAKKVKTLNLNCNFFCIACLTPTAKKFGHLSESGIEGIAIFAQALQGNKHISALNLSGDFLSCSTF